MAASDPLRWAMLCAMTSFLTKMLKMRDADRASCLVSTLGGTEWENKLFFIVFIYKSAALAALVLQRQVRCLHRSRAKMSTDAHQAAPSMTLVGTKQRARSQGLMARAAVAKGI